VVWVRRLCANGRYTYPDHPDHEDPETFAMGFPPTKKPLYPDHPDQFGKSDDVLPRPIGPPSMAGDPRDFISNTRNSGRGLRRSVKRSTRLPPTWARNVESTGWCASPRCFSGKSIKYLAESTFDGAGIITLLWSTIVFDGVVYQSHCPLLRFGLLYYR